MQFSLDEARLERGANAAAALPTAYCLLPTVSASLCHPPSADAGSSGSSPSGPSSAPCCSAPALIVQLNSPGAVPLRPFYLLISLSYALTVVNALTVRLGRPPPLARGRAPRVRRHHHLGVHRRDRRRDQLLRAALRPAHHRARARSQGRRGSLIMGGALVGDLRRRWSSAQYEANLARSSPAAFGQAAVVLPPARVARVHGRASTSSPSWRWPRCRGRWPRASACAGASLARASKEIEDLQAFSQDIIDSLTSGLLTTDVTGPDPDVQQRGRADHRALPSAAVIDRNVADVLQWPDEMTRALASDLGGQRSRRADFVYHTGDGRRIELGLAVAHLLDAGRQGRLPPHVPGRHRDEAARARRARRASAWRRSARWRPGSRTRSATRWRRWPARCRCCATSSPLDDEQAQLMDIVLRESTRLNETIRGFLAYARPQRTVVSPPRPGARPCATPRRCCATAPT